MDGQWFPKQPVQFERGPRSLDPWADRDFFEILAGLNLTDGLKVVLDAGDGASYTSGQSWLDLAGSGYDFFRGADGSATSTDPTFNGSAGGLSSSEYFSFDGGDYFTYDSANETWMNNLHKSGAKFTVMMWVNLAAIGGGGTFFSTSRANTADVGVIIRMAGGDGRPVLQVFSGGGTVHTSVPIGALTTSTWQLLGMSLDTSDGTSGSKFFIDGTTETFSGSYSSPSSAAATYTAKIGADGATTGGRLASGSRVAGVMAWEGVALSGDQMTNVFTATRDRFGV